MPVFNPPPTEGSDLVKPKPRKDGLARVPFLDAESSSRGPVRQDVVQKSFSIESLEHQASDGAEISVEMNLKRKKS